MEEWKDIEGYEGLYQVSNKGRVRSLNYNHTRKVKNLSLVVVKNGYIIVGLVKNGKTTRKYVHRLVAETFIPNPNHYGCVNHKNEDKTLNSVENLEWCDHRYNDNYGTRNDRIRTFARNREDQSKKVYQYTLDGDLVRIYQSTRECGRQGFQQSNVQRCCTGEHKQHKGYKWSYKPL